MAAARARGAEPASTVFVGSISPGVSDYWLTQLLEACGSFRSLKRVSKAFGFADFTSAHAVLRALAILNGIELPSMGVERASPRKQLVVRADDKTRQFLTEFERTLQRTPQDEQEEDDARTRVQLVVSAMANSKVDGGDALDRYVIPTHLKDLPVHELPVERRHDVLSEIEKFRLSAIARDAADRRRELELERRRSAKVAAAAAAARSAERRETPPASATPEAEPSVDPERADEEAEERRAQEHAEQQAQRARDAQRAFDAKERARIARWDARPHARLGEPSAKEKEYALSKWDALAEDAELSRELFWTDRHAWLHQRAALRDREAADDARDRAAEASEAAAAQEEADRFLRDQELAIAQMPTIAGLRPDAVAPLKLRVHRTGDDAYAEDAGDPGVQQRRALLAQLPRGDEAAARAAADALLPADYAGLSAIAPGWAWIDEEAAVSRTYAPLLDAGIEASLGERVDDLRDAAVEKVRACVDARSIVDVLEPVLEEDATDVVSTLWRALLVDSLGREAGAPAR
ncbi:hypothetical protein MSPP1_003405 [Malassezia sp. CBS 17886]|nr:hypothetical protein MSPP1_003405 [Malassezia sp. CBS 17886]